MALTRATLAAVGGLEALAPFVADDGVLGRKVVAVGQRVGLAQTVPATTVGETSLAALLRHELRWARTIRAMAPAGFAASIIQYPVFWALLAMLLSAGQSWSLAVLAGATLARIALGRLTERVLGAQPAPLWLAPLRDLLSVGVLVTAFLDDRVDWRGQMLSTAPDRALTRHDDHFISPPPLMAHGEG